VGCRVVTVAVSEAPQQGTLLHPDPEDQTARHGDGKADDRQPVPDELAHSRHGQQQSGITRMPDQPVGPPGDYRLITTRLDGEGEVTAQSMKAPEAQGDATPQEAEPDPGGGSGGADRRTRRLPDGYERATMPATTASRKTSSLLRNRTAATASEGWEVCPVELVECFPVPGVRFRVVGRVVGHRESMMGGVELEGVVDPGVSERAFQ
jgi:hypothetical protein